MSQSFIGRGMTILSKKGVRVFLKKTLWFLLHEFFLAVWIKTTLGFISVCVFAIFNGRARIKKIGENPDALFDFVCNNFLGYFKPAQVREEFLTLLRMLSQSPPKTILEIGTFKGGTLFCFSRIAPSDATIVSLDLPGGGFGGGYGRIRTFLYSFLFKKPGQKMIFLRMDSHATTTLQAVRSTLGGATIDFLFIDGDHSYEGAKKDFDMYGSMVVNGGMIGFHDIAKHPAETHCDVDKLWKQISGETSSSVSIIESEDQGWGGIGVLKR